MGLLQLNISPYDPLVDVVQTDEIKIIDGENFLPIGMQYISVSGLRQLSARFELGERYRLYHLSTTNSSQLFLTSSNGLYRIDTETNIPFKLVERNDDGVNRWTIAFVGGYYYFCGGNGTALYRYDMDTNELIISQSSSVNPVACCNSDGRLILLNDKQIIWSAMDDGENITPSLETGAGYQTLGKVGGGIPITLSPIANGFLAFTSKGIVAAKVVNASTIFYFNQLLLTGNVVSTPDKVINLDDNTACFLTNNTLYLYDGATAQAIIPNHIRWFLNTGRIAETWLDYDPSRSWLCLHTRDTNFIYDIQLQSMGRVKLYNCLPKDGFTIYNGGIYAVDSRDLLYTISDEYYLLAPEEPPLVTNTRTIFYSLLAESFGGNPADYFYGYAAIRERVSTAIQFEADIDSELGLTEQPITIDLMQPSTRWGTERDLEIGTDLIDLGKNEEFSSYFPSVAEATASFVYIKIKPGAYEKQFIQSFIHIGSFRVNKEIPIDNTIIMSRLALFGGINSALDTFIDMNTVPTVFINMNIPESPDTFVFMGINPSGDLNEDVEVRGTSDGKRELTTHYKKPTLVYNAQDRQEFAVYNTGIYHSIKVSSTERAGIRLAQVQIDAFKGGKFYGKTPIYIPH